MVLRVKREPLADVICRYVSYQFDDFVVDPVAFRLSKSGQPASIEPKALQVLITLIERRDRLVGKQELFDEVWPGVAVTENALTRAIAQLRKTLADSADSPRYVETVPTRGYRFIGQLRTEGAPSSVRPASDKKKIVVIAILAAALGVNGGAPVQLTRFGSRPSWSPDGTEIAFQSAEDIEYGWNAYEALPPSTIWIVNVASGKVVPLTMAARPPGGHGAPSWRRDGKRIAFSSCDHERCRIFTIARDSSGVTQLATDSRRLASPVFAADGRTVYFVLSLYNESLLLSISVDADGKATDGPKR